MNGLDYLKHTLKGCHTFFIINDCSAEGEIIKKRDALYQNLLLVFDIGTIPYGY